MKILGIDSSIPQGSVALLKDHKILFQSSLTESSKYSDRLLPLVDLVLSKTGFSLNEVDSFCITRGPGSFTGLRVGVSLIKGFVLSTEKPFVGVDTLEAVAACVKPTDQPICALLDARKKQVYTAFFKYRPDGPERISEDRAIEPEALCDEISSPTVFAGYGLNTYKDFLQERLGPLFIASEPDPEKTVAAGAAFLASDQFKERLSFDLNDLKIQYIRKSEAELNFTG